MPAVQMTDLLVKDRMAATAGMHMVRFQTWARLEPQCRSGNPAAGCAARVHDPLWMLGRQWQVGEFAGEDCGTPVSVEVTARTRRVTGLRPGGARSEAAPLAIGPDSVVEPDVEREPWAPPSLRDRAEASAALVAALTRLGWGEASAMRAACPFDLAAPDIVRSAPDAAWSFVAARSADAEAVAAALEAAAPPVWLGSVPGGAEAAVDWLGWYRRNVSPADRTAESWRRERLEYRFALRAGEGEGAQVLEAPRHDGGPIDWHSFDLGEAADFLPESAAPDETHRAKTLATRLRYAGQPADRHWQFEDGRVNIGLTDVQPNDLARLAMLEYATVYGNDWLVAPVDLPRGRLAEVTEVVCTTTFGERVPVARASEQGRAGRFSLFSTSGPKGSAAMFVIPPGGRTAIEGPAREEVVFARDETANLAWAIEHRVEGADGLGRDRAREPRVLPPAPVFDGTADLVYRLETETPPHWIPLVPVPEGGGGFHLRKGSFDEVDGSRGRILAPTPFDVMDEEIPREGVRVRRVPCLMRDDAGRHVRWIARRVGPASGEASSGLAWDNTFRAP